jgi:aspartate aminotransferase
MASGSICQDTQGIRICSKAQVPIILAATYSKAFALYSERVGVICVTAPDREVSQRLEMQLRLITRYETGGYPAFGSSIVEIILNNPDLKALWEKDVDWMANQLQSRRKWLRNILEELGTPGSWEFITEQKGMFW